MPPLGAATVDARKCRILMAFLSLNFLLPPPPQFSAHLTSYPTALNSALNKSPMQLDHVKCVVFRSLNLVPPPHLKPIPPPLWKG